MLHQHLVNFKRSRGLDLREEIQKNDQADIIELATCRPVPRMSLVGDRPSYQITFGRIFQFEEFQNVLDRPAGNGGQFRAFAFPHGSHRSSKELRLEHMESFFYVNHELECEDGRAGAHFHTRPQLAMVI